MKIGGILGLNVVQDQDNFVQDIIQERENKRNTTFLMMGNMMKGGGIDEEDLGINDFEQLEEDHKRTDLYGNQTDFQDEEFEYQIAQISMDGFQKDNQLLQSKPKNDFELLYQYADPYPFLEIRKVINLVTISISYVCYSIISHKYFDNLILLIILFNSIMLMISDPTTDETNETKLAIETFFLFAYLCECILKIVGLGFIFKKKSYLRDGWNILDFIIVVSSILPFFLGADSGVSLTALRSLRILRPLKSVSNIRNLKVILITLFGALKDLVNTIIILVFFFLIFAIGGLQMFMGLLKRRCFEELTGIPHEEDIICGNKACPEGYICGKMIENPNWGVTNFDNLAYSFLMVFQCVTMEGWTEIMYWLFDAFSIFVVFYFVLLVFIGSFFLLNLTLAVIKAKFTDTQTDDTEEVDEEYHIDILMLKNWRKQERLFKEKILKKRNNKIIEHQYGQSIKNHNNTDFEIVQKANDFTWEGIQLQKQLIQQLQNKKEEWNNKKNKISLKLLNQFEEQERQKIQNITQKFSRQKQTNQAVQKYTVPQQRLIYHKREEGSKVKKRVNFLGIQKSQNTQIQQQYQQSQLQQETPLQTQQNQSSLLMKKQSIDSASTQDWVKNMNDFIDENQFKELPAFKSQQNNLNLLSDQKDLINIQNGQQENENNSPELSASGDSMDNSANYPNQDDIKSDVNLNTARLSSQVQSTMYSQDISILQLKSKQKKSMQYVKKQERYNKKQLPLYDTTDSNTREQMYDIQGSEIQQQQQQQLNPNNLITFGHDISPDQSANGKIQRQENRKQSNISLQSVNSFKNGSPKLQEFLDDSDFIEKKELRIFKDLDDYFKQKQGIETNYVCKNGSNLGDEQNKQIFTFCEQDIKNTKKKIFNKRSSHLNILQNPQKRFSSVQPKRQKTNQKNLRQQKTLNNIPVLHFNNSQNSDIQNANFSFSKENMEQKNNGQNIDSKDKEQSNFILNEINGGQLISERDVKKNRVVIKKKLDQIHIGSNSDIEESDIQSSQITESDIDSEIEKKQIAILQKKQQWENNQHNQEITDITKQNQLTLSTEGEEIQSVNEKKVVQQNQLKIKQKQKSQQQLEQEELDKKNVFKWKIVVNVQSHYTSSSYEDVLEHAIQEKEQEMIQEEQEKLNNQKYRLKYRLKRKPVEAPLKKKLKKDEQKLIKQKKKLEEQKNKELNKKKLETALKSRQSVFLQMQQQNFTANTMSFQARLLNLYEKKVIPSIKSDRTRHILREKQEIQEPTIIHNIVKEEQVKKNKKNKELYPETSDDIEITYRNIRRLIRQPIKKTEEEKNTQQKKSNKKHIEQNQNQNQNEGNQNTQLAIIASQKDSNRKIASDDLKGQFLLISKNDYDTGIKKDFIWSGNDVIRNLGNYKHQNQILKVLSSESQDFTIWIKGITGFLIVCHKHLRNFVNGSLFNSTLTIAVMLNTIVLAMDGLFQDEQTNNLLSDFNTFFTYLFIIEMILKLIGLTPVGYVRDKMNIFDGCIVILSVFELIFFSGENSAVSAFRALRIFRVLRVTRLLRGLAFMAKIILVIAKTIDQFVWVAVLLFIFIFIYSLLGMQIYGGKFTFEDNEIRQNFDKFQNSAIVIFQLITMENWQQILHLCLRSDVFKILSALFLISWIWIGSFVFLNLFLSILLDGFCADDLDEEYDDEDGNIYEDENESQLALINTVALGANEMDQFQAINMGDENEGKKNYLLLRLPTEEEEAIKQQIKLDKQKHLKPLFDDIKCQKSLFFLSQQSKFRIFCYKICVHGHFEHVILTFIIISSLKLVVDTYFEPDSEELKVSQDIDIFFNTVFAIECILKVCSFGFILDHNSYLQDSWNRLDFFIVVSSIIDMSFESVNVPVIKILRLLRTLRPLRFISHNKNMKIVVIALLESVTPIINVMVVIGMIWIMFAILGISLIGGRMGYCAVPEDESYYGVSKQECLDKGYKWKTWDTNFDNIFTAMNTLFVISSLEGWPDYMFLAVDSQPPENGPIKDSYVQISLYYIIFILVGSFFLVNLFVGVIFMHFNEAQKNEKVCALFTTPEQERWIEFQQMILGVKAQFSAHKQPDNLIRKWCYLLAINPWFDGFIMVCIILNIVTMGMVYEGSSLQYNEVLDYVNLVFTFVFIFELIIKITGFGPKGFWVSSWNKFDAFVVVASIIDLVMAQLGSGIPLLRVGPQLARVMRVLRVSRLLKLVKSMKSLHKIIETLIFCMPSLINVGALLLLFFFIFSVLGVFTFRDVTEGDAIDNYNNFSNFGYAMLTLFRCATGEDWALFMYDLARKEDDCVQGVNCGSDFAIPYFLLFILFTQFIMLNLFIMIIIQFFEDYSMKEGNPLETFNEQLEIFRNYWSKYSAWSNGAKIKKRHITSFLSELPNPLGYARGQNDSKDFLVQPMAEIYRDVMSWNLTDDGEGNIFFNEILYGCMKKAYGIDQMDNADNELKTFVQKLETETKLKIEETKKKQKQKNRQIAFQNEANAINETAEGSKKVNPMVLYLFTLMAFKSWQNYSDKDKQGQLDISETEQEDDEYEEEQLHTVQDQENNQVSQRKQSNTSNKSQEINQEQQNNIQNSNQKQSIHNSEQKQQDQTQENTNRIRNSSGGLLDSPLQLKSNNSITGQQNSNNFKKYKQYQIQINENDEVFSQISDNKSSKSNSDNEIMVEDSINKTQMQSDSSKIAYQKISENNRNAYSNNSLLQPRKQSIRPNVRRQSVLDIGLLKNQIIQQNEAIQQRSSHFKLHNQENVKSRKSTNNNTQIINEEQIQQQALIQKRQMQQSEFSQDNMLKSNLQKSRQSMAQSKKQNK